MMDIIKYGDCDELRSARFCGASGRTALEVDGVYISEMNVNFWDERQISHNGYCVSISIHGTELRYGVTTLHPFYHDVKKYVEEAKNGEEDAVDGLTEKFIQKALSFLTSEQIVSIMDSVYRKAFDDGRRAVKQEVKTFFNGLMD